jgi:hypothetical protein
MDGLERGPMASDTGRTWSLAQSAEWNTDAKGYWGVVLAGKLSHVGRHKPCQRD